MRLKGEGVTILPQPSTPSPCPSPTRGEGTSYPNFVLFSHYFLLALFLLFTSAPTHAAQVTSVLDGDTIRLSDGKTVRYFGINTPEYGQPFAEEAKHYNEQLVLGKEVRVVPARRRPDAYKRVLAYVYVNNSLINTQLVTAGLAHIFILDPFDRSADWLRLQQDAQTRGKGMWRPGGVQGPLKITTVHADARGDDRKNPNGEYIRICNMSPQPVGLTGFAIQDEKKHRYVFSTGSLRPGYTALLSSGPGPTSVQHGQYRFHWDTGPVWNNTGDTAFLFDPDGKQIDSFPVRPKRLTPPRQAR